jgi:hypothetical protein
MPIIEMQRRFAEVGRIRAGAKTAKGHPTRLETWRLTSANRAALDAAAAQYGGDVVEWVGSPTPGQYEVITKTASLDVIVPPLGEPYSLWYEEWSGGGAVARCDGKRNHLTDEPCSCTDDARRCKPTLRVSLMLPALPGLGVWRFESHGWYAATELPITLDLLASAGSLGTYLRGHLRLEERRRVAGGQTKRFLVPVLDLDYSVGEIAAATSSTGEVPRGLEPPTVDRPALVAAPDPATDEAPDPVGSVPGDYAPASAAQKRMLWARAKAAGSDKGVLAEILAEVRGEDLADLKTITVGEVDHVLEGIKKRSEVVEVVEVVEPDEANLWGDEPDLPGDAA